MMKGRIHTISHIIVARQHNEKPQAVVEQSCEEEETGPRQSYPGRLAWAYVRRILA